MKSKIELPQTLKASHEKIRSQHKPWYKSKTLWINIALLALPLIEQTREYLLANPEQAMTAYAVINIVLRTITKEKLTLRDLSKMDEEIVMDHPRPPEKPKNEADKNKEG